ncbi:unnamed protein product [Prunus brigantina]
MRKTHNVVATIANYVPFGVLQVIFVELIYRSGGGGGGYVVVAIASTFWPNLNLQNGNGDWTTPKHHLKHSRGRKPGIKHPKVFGCIRYTHVPSSLRQKFDDKSRKGVFMGYGSREKGYRVYDLQSKKIVLSRSVIFNEDKAWNWKSDQEESAPILFNLGGNETEAEFGEEQTEATQFDNGGSSHSNTIRRLQVKGLKSEDALQLLSWKAFKKDYPEKYYLILSNRIVSYVKGLPLALEVLGSFLHGRGLSEWNSTLGKLGVCNLEIFEALKISYDVLDDNEKKMFLDIACFFNGKDKDRVIEACDVSAVVIVEVLIERSLVKILGGKLWMHDSLQEMGQQIVLREFLDEPGRCSRLWFREDVNHNNLRNRGNRRHSSAPSSDPGVQPLHNLKTIKLSHSLNLVSTPNFKGMPNLEVLILEDCTRLFEVDPSIQVLERLIHFEHQQLTLLNLKDCKNLAHLPSSVGYLKSLKVLNLFGCSRLNILPEELGYIECLEELDVSRTAIRELPSSIGRLKGLTLMNLKDCKYSMHLPTSVNGLKCL